MIYHSVASHNQNEDLYGAQPPSANVTYFRNTMLYPNERCHSEHPLSSRAFSSARE